MHTILVLMSTYNGEKYLKTQIDSILAQENVKVNLLVRDDGSTDSTQAILQEYSDAGKLQWYTGQNLGPARSFMNLIKNSKSYDYYAFSDQDDYWFPDKLFSAVNILAKQNTAIPALYYSRTTLVDADLNKLPQSESFTPFIKFNNAVISSACTGCTVCFNKALRDIVNLYEPKFQIMHDAWIHKVCLAVNGFVYWDPQSHIYYRQHDHNVLNRKKTFFQKVEYHLSKLLNYYLLGHSSCSQSKGIKELYSGYKSFMSPEKQEICQKIIGYKKSLRNRLSLFFDKTISLPDKKQDRYYRILVIRGNF